MGTILGLMFLGILVPFVICVLPGMGDPKNKVERTRKEEPTIIVEQHITTTNTPEVPHKTIAEQFDTRFTNIVKNPWEGIL